MFASLTERSCAIAPQKAARGNGECCKKIPAEKKQNSPRGGFAPASELCPCAPAMATMPQLCPPFSGMAESEARLHVSRQARPEGGAGPVTTRASVWHWSRFASLCHACENVQGGQSRGTVVIPSERLVGAQSPPVLHGEGKKTLRTRHVTRYMAKHENKTRKTKGGCEQALRGCETAHP